MKTRLLLSSIAIGIFTANNAAATNGYFTHGYGTTHRGMAGAGVAISEDLFSAANNPAALSVSNAEISLGLALFSPDREYQASNVDFFAPEGFYLQPQTKKSENSYFLIPEFAIGFELTEQINIGLSVYANGGMNTEYAVSGQDLGTFYSGKAGVDLAQLFISSPVSYQLSESTRIGFAPVFVIQQFEATGVSSFADFSSSPTQLSNVGKDTSTGVGVHMGIQHSFNEKLDMGISYRSTVSMDEFEKYQGLFAEQGNFDLPSSFQIGLAYNLNADHQVLFDWQRINYAEVSSVANSISNIISSPLGSDDGAGFGWQDMNVIKFGYQWQRTAEQKLRAGVSYGEQPIPQSEVLFNILAPGVQEWHFTAGLTQQLSNELSFNFSAFYSPAKTVTGDNFLAPNQQVSLKMTQFGFGASATWRL